MLSRREFIKDLTRTRYMTLVSTVVLGTTFMPLLGMPEVYEWRAFQSAFGGPSNAEAAPSDERDAAPTPRTVRARLAAAEQSDLPPAPRDAEFAGAELEGEPELMALADATNVDEVEAEPRLESDEHVDEPIDAFEPEADIEVEDYEAEGFEVEPTEKF